MPRRVRTFLCSRYKVLLSGRFTPILFRPAGSRPAGFPLCFTPIFCFTRLRPAMPDLRYVRFAPAFAARLVFDLVDLRFARLSAMPGGISSRLCRPVFILCLFTGDVLSVSFYGLFFARSFPDWCAQLGYDRLFSFRLSAASTFLPRRGGALRPISNDRYPAPRTTGPKKH